jgi:hypothetical protein
MVLDGASASHSIRVQSTCRENATFETVWAKVTYRELVPIALQERAKRRVGDGESESGSTARDGDLVSVAEPIATDEELSAASAHGMRNEM